MCLPCWCEIEVQMFTWHIPPCKYSKYNETVGNDNKLCWLTVSSHPHSCSHSNWCVWSVEQFLCCSYFILIIFDDLLYMYYSTPNELTSICNITKSFHIIILSFLNTHFFNSTTLFSTLLFPLCFCMTLYHL